MRSRRKNKLIITILICIICLMGVGYAAFQTKLDIKGTSSIDSKWDIRITNVTESNKSGSAESAKTPSWTDLTANMEANLYSKGDYIEYEVTIENKGTFDAKLDDVITNIKSNNEAVLITFSGYTKGQTLYKNSKQVITVKVEYNPDYVGDASGTSGEVSVDFEYSQNEGGTIVPTEDYLVTYDCTTNGGNSCKEYNEYLSVGSDVDLNKVGSKEGFSFIGWNTNKDATEGLTSLNMGTNDITLYAIFKDTSAPVCTLLVKEATFDTVTIKAECEDVSGISKYEYSVNGDVYNDNGLENTYVFDSFNLSTVKMQATDGAGNKKEVYLINENLEKGYQLIYQVLKNKYQTVKAQKETYENKFLDKTYPVGSIYITTEYSTSTQVSSSLGGTWEVYGSGKTLVGVNTSDNNFDTVNKIGGSSANILAVTNLPTHTHSIPSLTGSTNSAGNHTHKYPAHWMGNGPNTIKSTGVVYRDSGTTTASPTLVVDYAGEHTHEVTTEESTSGSNGSHTHTVTTTASTSGSTGSGTSFTNLQPYITVYMYKRTE